MDYNNRRGSKSKLSQDQWEVIAKRYAAGENTPTLGKEYGVHKTTIAHHVKKMGVRIREREESFRKYNVNHDAFDELNEEALYWIGFLFADGCIYRRGKNPVISLALAARDVGHIEKFKKFIGSSHRIHIKKPSRGHPKGATGTAIISFPSSKIADRLSQFGFDLKKTRVPIQELRHSVDFWRGVFDGDGTLGIFAAKQIALRRFPGEMSKPSRFIKASLVGWPDMVEAFRSFIRERVPTNANSFRHGNIRRFALSANSAVMAIDLLYSGATVYLDRKFEKAQEILALRKAKSPVNR